MPEQLPSLPIRQADAHKGSCGQVLVIAGSTGMTGAGVLTSKAALRSGAGLVTWAIAESLNPIAEALCVEVMTLPLPQTAQKSPSIAAREHIQEAAMEAQAVVLGPGLSSAGETGELIRLLLPEINAPLVLDAGGLRALGTDINLLTRRKNPTILTPHPGEMGGLCGKSAAEIQANREAETCELATQSNSIVLLKGNNTVISNGTETAVNSTGSCAMATAGSGDVLCGVIAALVAQGMQAYDAAVLGAYLHGLAGDLASCETGMYGLIASDIIKYLPAAFMKYESDREAGLLCIKHRN